MISPRDDSSPLPARHHSHSRLGHYMPQSSSVASPLKALEISAESSLLPLTADDTMVTKNSGRRRKVWTVAGWLVGVGVIAWFGYVVFHNNRQESWWERMERTLAQQEQAVMNVGDGNGLGPTSTMVSETVETGSVPEMGTGGLGHEHEHQDLGSSPPSSSDGDEPKAVVIPDTTGDNNNTWTILLPSSLSHPLPPMSYPSICSSAGEVSHKAKALNNPKASMGHSHQSYYSLDKTFLDPADTSTTLPQNTCTKSITYVLETENPALGATLMSLFLSYGLAKHENRSFFIDDTNWAYGRWTDYFLPPPEEGCVPPLWKYRLPCPHQAKHLLIAESSNAETFGHEFQEEFQDPFGMDDMRQVNIFGLARKGFEELFLARLKGEDGEFVKKRIEGLLKQPIIGIHVRHGDGHPKDYWYHKSYVPLATYLGSARKLFALGNSTTIRGEEGKLVVISDDEGVYDLLDMKVVERAQNRVPLPKEEGGQEGPTKTKQSTPSLSLPPRPTMVVKQELPGFRSKNFPFLSVDEKRQLAHGYLLDLAILGGLVDSLGKQNGKMEDGDGMEARGGVVCAGTSYTCRLLAVMMGWEESIVRGSWRDVEEDRMGWKGWVW